MVDLCVRTGVLEIYKQMIYKQKQNYKQILKCLEVEWDDDPFPLIPST